MGHGGCKVHLAFDSIVTRTFERGFMFLSKNFAVDGGWFISEGYCAAHITKQGG